MKRSLRVVSILLALIMVIGLLPANFLGAISEAFADDSPYNLTIDFDYAENNNVTSASDALRVAVTAR